jgi:hypothetical protein
LFKGEIDMPYLTKDDKISVEKRKNTESTLFHFGESLKSAGELNYSVTQIIRGFYSANGGRYQQINDIVGALESAKAEFQRRIVGPYETKKAKENGDVY